MKTAMNRAWFCGTLTLLATSNLLAEHEPGPGPGRVGRCHWYTVSEVVNVPADVARKELLRTKRVEAERVRDVYLGYYKKARAEYQSSETGVIAAETALVAGKAECGPSLMTLNDLLAKISRTTGQRALYTGQKAITDQLLDVEDAYLLSDLGDYLAQANLDASPLASAECPAFAASQSHCELVQATLAMVERELADWRDRNVDYRNLGTVTPVLKVLQGLQQKNRSQLEAASEDLARLLERKGQELQTLETQRSSLGDMEERLRRLQASHDEKRIIFDRHAEVLRQLEVALAQKKSAADAAKTKHVNFVIRTRVVERREMGECT